MKFDFFRNLKNQDFIPARKGFWTPFFFNLYLDFEESRLFHKIDFQELNENLKHIQAPLLILCNHFSYWDALWIYNWNRKFLKKDFHCMVLRETLIKNPSLQKVGGYSVDPGKRSILETIAYTQELLKNPENMVLLFPQGRLLSGHTSYIHFEPGLERILKGALPELKIIFLAGFMDHFSQKKPEIRFYIQINKTKSPYLGLDLEYNSFYTQARIKQGERTN